MRLFFEFAFKNRLQFFCVMLGLIILTMAVSNYYFSVLISRGIHLDIIAADLRNALGMVVLMTVCTLLLPVQSQKSLKHA